MMDEFSKRLDEIKEARGGKLVEDIGVIDLTRFRDMYNDLLSDITAYVNDVRRDEDLYTIENVVEIAVACGNLKERIINERQDIITERRIKEDRITTLTNEKELLEKNEKLLAGYVFADENNLSDMDKSIKELQMNIPERIRRIEDELYLLSYGTVGLHLSERSKKAAVEEMLEERNRASIDGVSFTNPETKEEPVEEAKDEELEEVPDKLIEEAHKELEGSPEEEAKEEEKLEEVPAELVKTPAEELEKDEEEKPVPPALGLVASEADEKEKEVPAELGALPEESEEEKEKEVPAPLAGDLEEEKEEEKDGGGVLLVNETVNPKPTLWQKVGKALGLAIAFLAGAATANLAMHAVHTREQDGNEAIIDEDITPESEEQDTVTPTNTVVDGGTPSNPSDDKHDGKEENLDIKLVPGESVYDEKTGIEITANGDVTSHKNGETTELGRVELKKDSDGKAIVTSQDLAAPSVPSSAPAEQKQTGTDYIAEQKAAGNYAAAEAAEDAMDAVSEDVWKSLFSDSGPSL